MNYKKLVTTAVAASIFAATAFAHGGAKGIVKERMDGMSALGDTVKSLAPMMRGEGDYDAEAVRQGAEVIRSHAGTSLTKLFPIGSGGMPSEAKDTVWQDWEEFAALSERLHLYSEGLALAADNGLMMTQETTANTGTMMGGSAPMASNALGLEELAEMSAEGVFAMISQTCSACHTKFRAEAK